MDNEGTRWKYVYARLDPFLLKPFIIIGHRLILGKKNIFEDYAEYSGTKRRAIRDNPLSVVYQWLLLLDYSIQVLVKVKVPLILGSSIICDRYVYDTVATDLAVDFGYSDKKIQQTLRRLLRLFPKPQLVFLVDVPEEVAYRRKDDIPSIDYLRERRRVYLAMAQDFRFVVLDGCRTVADLEAEAKRRICR